MVKEELRQGEPGEGEQKPSGENRPPEGEAEPPAEPKGNGAEPPPGLAPDAATRFSSITGDPAVNASIAPQTPGSSCSSGPAGK